MTPIVRNADQKSISSISLEVHTWTVFVSKISCFLFILDYTIFFFFQLLLFPKVKELAEKARTGKLKPNEFQGGTFR